MGFEPRGRYNLIDRLEKTQKGESIMAGDLSGRRNGESISQINVTPFVDVMLVLLVIFMVTAPIIQQGVQVNLCLLYTSDAADE